MSSFRWGKTVNQQCIMCKLGLLVWVANCMVLRVTCLCPLFDLLDLYLIHQILLL